jgi:rhamnosyltransferase
MATFNGRRWIEPQVDSILGQEDVDVTLTVSDDGSDDGTFEYLAERSKADDRITVLPPRGGQPGVTSNFLFLFAHHPMTRDRYVAFSDQDDIWRADKLCCQVALLQSTGADAVSANVMSFNEAGRKRLIVKSAPQRRWDYIFEAAGPGSTYVFTPQMHAQLVGELRELDITNIGVHDWFLYALTRASGGSWRIEGTPLVAYRQHRGNVQGEHHGLVAFWHRFDALRSGFYRDQFFRTAKACRQVGERHQDAKWLAELDALIEDLRRGDVRSRCRIACRFKDLRRNTREGIELAAACVLGVW